MIEERQPRRTKQKVLFSAFGFINSRPEARGLRIGGDRGKEKRKGETGERLRGTHCLAHKYRCACSETRWKRRSIGVLRVVSRSFQSTGAYLPRTFCCTWFFLLREGGLCLSDRGSFDTGTLCWSSLPSVTELPWCLQLDCDWLHRPCAPLARPEALAGAWAPRA